MKKIKQYEMYKISTDRIAREKYNINLTYKQSIINDELIKLGSNQTIRALRKMLSYDDDCVFIKEYMAIKVDKNKHYNHIKTHGLFVNGEKFVRFSCGAGNARNEIVFLIQEKHFNQLFEIVSCGITPKNINLSKWNAYFALNGSNTYEISEPKVCVIPDYTVNLKHMFDFIDSESNIIQKEIEIKDYCPFDGQGIVSVEFAKQIDKDVELNYMPSACVIRNSYIKGMVCTMDIKLFIKEIANNDLSIADLWGKQHCLNEIDMILTESQFKMWKEYSSWQDYLDKSKERDLVWGVTIFTHEKDDNYTFTNYQFLQVLDLDEAQIKEICKPTIEWIRDITGNDVDKLLLYYLGHDKEIIPDNIQQYDVKSLLYNHELINDNYIKTRVARSLNKKIRQAFSGKLLIDGNFSFMISDPFALMQYSCGFKNITGLLKEDEYYNGYWNRKNVCEIAGMRSPLTFASEVNIMKLKNNQDCNKWYQHIDNCCTVFNIFGDDTMRMADADFDGDKCATTSCKQIIEGVRKEFPYPITYDKNPTPKQRFSLKKLYKIDTMSFGSDIGHVTNCSTYWWSLLYNYDKGSIEYNEIINRLKLMRMQQGSSIDKSKGIKVKPMNAKYTKFDKCENELERSLVVCKKPYFQKYIYSKLSSDYNKFIRDRSSYSLLKYGVDWTENTDVEFNAYMNIKNPLLDNDSTMNKICHHLESEICEIKRNYKKQDMDIVNNILTNSSVPIKNEYIPFFEELLKKYKIFNKNEKENKINNGNEKSYLKKKRYSIFCKLLKDEAYALVKDSVMIANLSVFVGYKGKAEENKDFCWDVFGKEIFENVKSNKNEDLHIPIKSTNKDYDFEYLGEYFKRQGVMEYVDI